MGLESSEGIHIYSTSEPTHPRPPPPLRRRDARSRNGFAVARVTSLLPFTRRVTLRSQPIDSQGVRSARRVRHTPISQSATRNGQWQPRKATSASGTHARRTSGNSGARHGFAVERLTAILGCSRKRSVAIQASKFRGHSQARRNRMCERVDTRHTTVGIARCATAAATHAGLQG